MTAAEPAQTTFTTIAPLPEPEYDSDPGWTTGLPLAMAGLILLVVFTSIVVRARRNRRRPSEARPPPPTS